MCPARGIPASRPSIGRKGGLARLAGHVLKDLGETEALKPPRVPGAHVLLGIVTIDDHRAARIKPASGLPVQFLQRNVDRAGDVLGLILGAEQDVDQLCARGNEPPHLFALDFAWHDISFWLVASFLHGDRSQHPGEHVRDAEVCVYPATVKSLIST
jgi:hypothetical protein